MCLAHSPQRGISKHMLQMKMQHARIFQSCLQVLVPGCEPSSSFYTVSSSLCSSCRTEHNVVFTYISVSPSWPTPWHISDFYHLKHTPWLRRAGSYQRQSPWHMIDDKHRPSPLPTQTTARSTHWISCGHVNVDVQVLGKESPHASSYAGYLLLVMVTLLAHGRRGVMMEDGAR